jgi:hypothetical protein
MPLSLCLAFVVIYLSPCLRVLCVRLSLSLGHSIYLVSSSHISCRSSSHPFPSVKETFVDPLKVLVLSRLVSSRLVLPCLVLSCHCVVLSCNMLSFLVVSCRVLACGYLVLWLSCLLGILWLSCGCLVVV